MQPAELLTSIRLENGQFDLLDYHTERINRSRRLLYGLRQSVDLSSTLSKQNVPTEGLYKTRVLYDKEIKHIEFIPYQVKPIRSLKILPANDLDYRYKYTDRRAIQSLYEQKGTADDVLMVKNQRITDSSYANVAFWDGRAWYTPYRPLLRGTRRAQLLQGGKIYLADIRQHDLGLFSKFRLFNAMLPWEQAIELPTTSIF